MSNTLIYSQIKTEYGDINYYVYGNGPKKMLLFHGFGLDGKDMAPLAEHYSEDYTCYSFDLFHHGRTFWTSDEISIEKAFWVDTLSSFLRDNKIDRFSITAFSLGGKLALVTTELFSEQIDRLILLAPDGIKTRMWYNLATYPGIFQKYFKTIIVKPHRFHRLINILKMTGAIDKGILKFANHQMDTRLKRRRIYYSWIAFKNLKTDLEELAQLINKSNIEVTMYLGLYDKMITENGVRTFTNLIKNMTTEILDTGHNDLIDHTAESMKKGLIT